MKNQVKFWLWLFLGISFLEVLSQIIDWELGHFIFKPLVIPSLAFYFYFSFESSRKNSSILNLGLAALIFSWLGDIFLLVPALQDIFFMLGLGSFLIAHLIYLIVYNKATDKLRGTRFLRRKPGYALPFLFAGAFLYYQLWPVIGELAIPVGVYTIVIILMALSALYRFNKTNLRSFVLVLGGAVFFIISDTILSINKFLTDVPFAGFFIMFTYITAQFLIIEGLINHTDLKENRTSEEIHRTINEKVSA
jgi:uncharacterized membrane protein YhhN